MTKIWIRRFNSVHQAAAQMRRKLHASQNYVFDVQSDESVFRKFRTYARWLDNAGFEKGFFLHLKKKQQDTAD